MEEFLTKFTTSRFIANKTFKNFVLNKKFPSFQKIFLSEINSENFFMTLFKVFQMNLYLTTTTNKQIYINAQMIQQ